ncbi:MAG: AmmeMemoRadiSam system protein B [Candidatus Micrarchaeaceae archaeon]|jgi:MEMO1 family protein
MRKSVFNGSFYPSGKEEIINFINSSIEKVDMNEDVGEAHSYVAPHAGYIYSGKTAAFTYKAIQKNSRIEQIETLIMIGPNHTGIGRPISVSMEDWETPLGKSINDRELSKAIVENSEYINVDEQAHESEHSIEVQLPFIQYIFPKKKVVLICMGDQSIEASEILSNSIIKSMEQLKRKVLVIASSDFNHYESSEIAKKKDSKLLEAAEVLDYKKFNDLIDKLNDSACGFGPITVAMMFAKHMHSKKGIILKYTNSGEETKDYSSVVAYCAIAFL